MQITIHRGTHEVGGNCVEIVTDQSRIVLDVGMPLFHAEGEPYDTAALRRKTKEQLRESDILPTVPGLFDSGPKIDAILLSHAHEDHTGLIQHSLPEIPIHTSQGTSKMMLAGFKFAGQPHLPRNRFRKVTPGTPFQVGDITVTGYLVDHSIYAALAFLIEADGKRLLYSGDLRLHGRKPGMVETLRTALKDKPVDVLLMEGTHINHPDISGPTEFELEDEIFGHIKSASGLVLASFSPQHVDRLVAFLRTAKKSGRMFVADVYTAFIMHLIASEVGLPSPQSTDWVKVFFPKFFEESFRKKGLEEIYFLLSPPRIGMEELRNNPSRYVMLFRPSMLQSDFGGDLPEHSRCLYSRWTGYLDRPDWHPVKEALKRASGDLIEAHTSGHIFADDINELIQKINPRTVVPIHTFEPERFHEICDNVRVLADGERWTII